jgi:hypothetical protein
MNDWKYSQAQRCITCAMRAAIPTRDIADRFVAKSEHRLSAVECPHGNGWHLVYRAVELAPW